MGKKRRWIWIALLAAATIAVFDGLWLQRHHDQRRAKPSPAGNTGAPGNHTSRHITSVLTRQWAGAFHHF